MSVVNLANALVELNKKIENTTDEKELLILSKAIEKLKVGFVYTVQTFAELPTASDSIGKLYLVKNDNILYFAFNTDYGNVYYWIPITNISANVLWSWGNNNGFQLGAGGVLSSTECRCSPGTVFDQGSSVARWCSIAAGRSTAVSHAAAIKTDGTLWTWGTNICGALGDGTTVNRCSPGTIWGGGTTWCQVSNNCRSTFAIKCDGTLWTWGCNGCGNLGDGTTVDRCSPGTVWGGGNTWYKLSTTNSSNAVVAIKTDGTLWTWGSNPNGTLGDGTTVTRCSPGTIWGGGTTWCQVSGGSIHTAAIKTDGTLWTWGSNNIGQLADGTVSNRCSPGTVAGGGTTWCQTSECGAIKTDGTLWTWGCNSCGQLGDGTTVSRCSPGTIAGGGTTWCQVFSGDITKMAAIKTDGTLWTWGRNYSGALGDGTTVNRCSPETIVGGGNKWINVSFGGNFTLAITKETL